MTHIINPEDDIQTVQLGFWLYLMTDCLLFASLFATYAVLHGGTANGVTSADIFNMDFVLVQTIILLTSSMTSGFAYITAKAHNYRSSLYWLLLTIVLGFSFLALELYEFQALLSEGNSWQSSAFLSAFYTLVATHGLHIFVGILWASVLLYRVIRLGIQPRYIKQLTLFTLFWHFLDIIWIFIFTFVYAIGSLK